MKVTNLAGWQSHGQGTRVSAIFIRRARSVDEITFLTVFEDKLLPGFVESDVVIDKVQCIPSTPYTVGIDRPEFCANVTSQHQ